VISISAATIVEMAENQEIYDDRDDSELRASIEEFGLLEPVHVIKESDDSYLLVSGHRRLKCLRDILGPSAKVPAVVISDPGTQYGRTALLLQYNQYRVKTKEELIREGLLLEKLYQAEKGKRLVDGSHTSGERTRDVVANQIGISARAYDDGKKVLDGIITLQKTDPELASEVRERLKTSIDGARKLIAQKAPEVAPQTHRKQDINDYWPVLKKLLTQMETAYIRLKNMRNHKSSHEFSCMVGNIMDMHKLLATWDPASIEAGNPPWHKETQN
jgi:hypothetical protein